MTVELSAAEARRLVLSAQGFGKRPAKAGLAHVRNVASKIHCFRIDSVSVLTRAHYLPAFSRLGRYPIGAVDALAYERRELFEVAGRGVSLVPVALYPLFRYRMDVARALGPSMPDNPRPGVDYVQSVYDEVAERGPLTTRELSNPGKRYRGKWWSGTSGKLALEHLLQAGRLAVAQREGTDRVFDIAERVIPRAILEAQYPDREESEKQLMCLAAGAQGVATARELTWYFGLPHQVRYEPGSRRKPVFDRLARELVEDGRLVQVTVEGSKDACYMASGARVPKSMDARALIGPFDSLMWGRFPPLCEFEQFLAQQLYLPANRRMFGYYVLPLLLGDRFAGRCDLRTDRDRKLLVVESSHFEPDEHPADVAQAMAAELREMTSWLGLRGIEVAGGGDLAPHLYDAVATPRA